jgi:hypothetical protein
MVYGEKIAGFFLGGGEGNNTKHINAPCGQNGGFWVLNRNVILYNAVKPNKYDGKQFRKGLISYRRSWKGNTVNLICVWLCIINVGKLI